MLNIFKDGRLSASRKLGELRPIFSIKMDTVKITGGDGKSESTAYTLGR